MTTTMRRKRATEPEVIEPKAAAVTPAPASTSLVSLSTPFRTIPALTVEQWVYEFESRGSPVSRSEVEDCYAACGGWALLLDQAIGETSLKDADAIKLKNLLRLTAPDGSTFKSYSAYWKPFAEAVKRLYDPAYKNGAYYPIAAQKYVTATGGFIDGYNLSLAGYKVTYIGGPGCLSSKGKTCANGETYDPAKPMTGTAVINDASAPSINRSIAAAMSRYERWFGNATPTPTGPSGPSGPTEPPPGSVTLGKVPPPKDLQLRVIWNNTAWDDLGRRQPRGIVLHRMLGTLNGTDAYFRNEAAGRALTDFGVGNGSLGRVYQWNLLDGQRAPWASGPADGVKEDGVPFVNRYGVNAINRDCASIEVEGNYADPVPAQTWQALIELVAWIADSWLRVDYQTWPKNRDGLHALLGHYEFTGQKPCPGSAVLNRVPELIESVRQRLRQYQTQ